MASSELISDDCHVRFFMCSAIEVLHHRRFFNSGTHKESDMAVMALSSLEAVTHVYGKSEKAGGSGHWELRSLWE